MWESFYILIMNTLTIGYFENIFSQFIACLYSYPMPFFDEQNSSINYIFLYGLNHFSSQGMFTTLKSQRYSMLFSKCFIVLCSIFIYLSHLELISLVFSEVRNQVKIFPINTQLSKCKRYFSSLLCHVASVNYHAYMCGSTSGLSAVLASTIFTELF